MNNGNFYNNNNKPKSSARALQDNDALSVPSTQTQQPYDIQDIVNIVKEQLEAEKQEKMTRRNACSERAP